MTKNISGARIAPITESLMESPVQLPDSGQANELYIDLLKRCLTRELFDEHYRIIPRNTLTPWRAVRSFGYGGLNRILDAGGLALVQKGVPQGETMTPPASLDNVEHCVRSVLEDKVPGDFIETGVWKGGTCIFMRALLELFDKGGDRRVFVADSFQGLPKSDSSNYPADRWFDSFMLALGVSVEKVRRNFERYRMLDDRVQFLVGWFKDTLPTAPIEKLAILRLDGDLYESTIQALDALYPKLSVGGYCIIDDYGHIPPCAQAVEDYRRGHRITEPIEKIDHTIVCWRRTIGEFQASEA